MTLSGVVGTQSVGKGGGASPIFGKRRHIPQALQLESAHASVSELFRSAHRMTVTGEPHLPRWGGTSEIDEEPHPL